MPSFAERFRRRQGLGAITGFNGGSLQDQLDEDAVNQPDVSGATRPRIVNPVARAFQSEPLPQADPATSMNRYEPPMRPTMSMDNAQPDMATRPRSTNPFLDRLMNDPSRQERPREVNPADEITKSSDYLRQIQDKPLSFRDKVGLVAQSISANLGGTPLPTRRQRDLARARGQLGQDITVQGQQLKSQAIQNQMDARDAAQRTAEERLTQGQSRLDQTALNQRRQRLVSQHSELKEFNPDDPKNAGFVAAWTKEFGYPPPKKVSGSLLQYNTGYDKDGNLVAEITDKGTGQVTQTQGGNITQTEQGANRKQSADQFKVAEGGRNERARLGRAAAMDRTLVMAKATGARLGDPKEFEDLATEAEQNAKTAEDEAKSDTLTTKEATQRRAEAERHRQLAFKLREAAIKARGGQSVGATPQSTPKRQFNENAFRAKFQEKHGRQPTETEIAPYRNAQ